MNTAQTAPRIYPMMNAKEREAVRTVLAFYWRTDRLTDPEYLALANMYARQH